MYDVLLVRDGLARLRVHLNAHLIQRQNGVRIRVRVRIHLNAHLIRQNIKNKKQVAIFSGLS